MRDSRSPNANLIDRLFMGDNLPLPGNTLLCPFPGGHREAMELLAGRPETNEREAEELSYSFFAEPPAARRNRAIGAMPRNALRYRSASA
jgi:hypothetical protein